MESQRKLTVVAALFANLGIAVSKFVVGAISGSASIISEAIHSAIDTGNELVLLLGQNRAKRPPNRAHPFGHGLELYFWTLIVAVLLFAIGGGMSIYEGVTHILHPPEQNPVIWTYVVLGIAFVAEANSWRIAVRSLRRASRYGDGFWKVLKHIKDPQLVAVFLEDTGALAGILVAAAGVTLSHVLHQPVWDGAAAIVIGLILCSMAVLLARETRNLLIGEAADARTVDRLQQELGRQRGVVKVARPLTMHFGPEEVLVNLDVQFEDDLNAVDLARVVDEMEDTVRKFEPRAKRIFIEAESLENAPH